MHTIFCLVIYKWYLSFQEERTDSARPCLHRQPHLPNDRGLGKASGPCLTLDGLGYSVETGKFQSTRNTEIMKHVILKANLIIASHKSAKYLCLELIKPWLYLFSAMLRKNGEFCLLWYFELDHCNLLALGAPEESPLTVVSPSSSAGESGWACSVTVCAVLMAGGSPACLTVLFSL